MARLGIYVDDIYRVVKTSFGPQYSTDRAFLVFACEVGSRFDRVVLFGRSVEAEEPADYVLPDDVELIQLPHYESLANLPQVARATTKTMGEMWTGLSDVDVVWVFGPHPFALALSVLGLLRRRRIVLGVRQDTMAYHRNRLPGRMWAPIMGLVRLVDGSYSLLARKVPVTTVGTAIAARYRTKMPVLPMIVSVVSERDVVTEPAQRDWSGTLELLTVGRLEPEKNPMLVVEALARLDARSPGRYHLTWVGRGAMESAVRRRIQELGVEQLITLRGYIPFGDSLLALYRAAHVFLHVSLTEGVPQVLIEALASGTPIVATDVGGVASAVGSGDAALLVPPRDAAAIVTAVETLAADESVRTRLVERGLALAHERTLEYQADVVARFIAAEGSEAIDDPAPDVFVDRAER